MNSDISSQTLKHDQYTLTYMQYQDELPSYITESGGNKVAEWAEQVRRRRIHELAEQMIDCGIGRTEVDYDILHQCHTLTCSFIVGHPDAAL